MEQVSHIGNESATCRHRTSGTFRTAPGRSGAPETNRQHGAMRWAHRFGAPVLSGPVLRMTMQSDAWISMRAGAWPCSNACSSNACSIQREEESERNPGGSPTPPPPPPTNKQEEARAPGEAQQGVLVFFWWVLSVDDAEFVGVPKYFWLRGGVSGSEWSAGG